MGSYEICGVGKRQNERVKCASVVSHVRLDGAKLVKCEFPGNRLREGLKRKWIDLVGSAVGYRRGSKCIVHDRIA